jgi:hypothetical protein
MAGGFAAPRLSTAGRNRGAGTPERKLKEPSEVATGCTPPEAESNETEGGAGGVFLRFRHWRAGVVHDALVAEFTVKPSGRLKTGPEVGRNSDTEAELSEVVS